MRTAHRPFATRTLLLALCYTAAALLTLTSYAQSTLPSSMGTRFVFSVPPVEGVFGRSATVRLTVSSRDTAMVTCYEHTQRVTPDSQVVFFHEIRNGRIMPYIGIPDSADAVYTNRAVVVTSTAPVSLVCTVISRMGGESFTVLPENILGTRYIVASAQDVTSMYAADYFPSMTTITATRDRTVVTFTLGGNAQTTTQSGLRSGQSMTRLLDQGDVLVIANKIDGAGSDLSGSVITSTFPVAVVSGNQGANVPASTTGFNYIAEMEIPTDAWGTQYLIPPNETRLQSMMMKVFAAQPDTKLMRNSDLLWRHIETSGGTEGTGYIHERVNDGSNTAVTLTGDKPIGVTVYNPGYGEDSADAKPFQMGIIPVEHFGTYYQYSLPSVQMNTVQHNAILVYPLTSAYGIPDDLEVATEQNGIRVWQRVSAVFGSFTGSMFPTVVNNRRYAAKYIRLPLQRVYAFRAAIPFTVYMTGMISDGFSGGTTTYGSYCGMNYNSRSSQFADTIPPMPVVLSVTPSVVRGTVRDLPDDSTVRSNLLSISLHGQLSNNTTLAPGSVTGRASASWRVERIDRNADADACIIFKDVAGNDTILYVTFRGTKVGITGLKDNPPEKPKISASRNQQTFCRDSNIVLTLSATPGHTTYLWSNGDTTQTITVNTDTAGTLRYSVTVKNFFGDTAKSDVIFFQVLPVPRKPVIRFDGNETLSFDEENGVQYQWYFNERVLLGRTRSPMIIREKISGKYTVLATIAPCSTLSDEYFVSINSVEDDEPKQMSIRPNPASNEVRIRFESQSAGSVIEIVNTLGVNVRTMQIDEAGVVERSIDLRGLASGVYAVRIQSGGRVRMTRSFVKSH